MFVIINTDKNHAFVGEQPFGNLEAFVHKAEPFAVAVAVFPVYKAVVVLEIFVASVVGRVYVNYINAAFVGKSQGGKGVQVVAFN